MSISNSEMQPWAEPELRPDSNTLLLCVYFDLCLGTDMMTYDGGQTRSVVMLAKQNHNTRVQL